MNCAKEKHIIQIKVLFVEYFSYVGKKYVGSVSHTWYCNFYTSYF